MDVCSATFMTWGTPLFAWLTSGQTEDMTMQNDGATVETLDDLLADLTFPAEKWEVTTCADVRGAPAQIRRRLYDLPCRTFDSAEDVAEAL